jgi:hypothetical protein
MARIDPTELDPEKVKLYEEVYRLRALNKKYLQERRQLKFNEATALAEVLRLRRMVEMYEDENKELKQQLHNRDVSIRGYRRWHEVYRRELERMDAEG